MAIDFEILNIAASSDKASSDEWLRTGSPHSYGRYTWSSVDWVWKSSNSVEILDLMQTLCTHSFVYAACARGVVSRTREYVQVRRDAVARRRTFGFTVHTTKFRLRLFTNLQHLHRSRSDDLTFIPW